MDHREDIGHYPGTLTQLAGEIGDLRYDALASFLHSLAEKLDRDRKSDQERGRPQLASTLQAATLSVKAAATTIEQAWTICAPRM